MHKAHHDGVRCPLGHKKVWKIGPRRTKHGLKQRYLCVECGASFYAENGKRPEKKMKRKLYHGVVALID